MHISLQDFFLPLNFKLSFDAAGLNSAVLWLIILPVKEVNDYSYRQVIDWSSVIFRFSEKLNLGIIDLIIIHFTAIHAYCTTEMNQTSLDS